MIKNIRAIALEVVGLFVEDALYALTILVWLLIAGAVSLLHAGEPTTNALIFLLGFLTIVIVSVYRGATGR